MNPKRLAIACQGGGSQCAFVAGALKALFKANIQDRYRIVGLSGTSGGALTAALAWFGLLSHARGDRTPIEKRIIDLWRDLTAQTPFEMWLDDVCVQVLRLVERGALPSFAISPSCVPFRIWQRMLSLMIGRPEFTDLGALLTGHLDFSALPSLIQPDSPVLLVGACDVSDGTFKTFSSARGEIKLEALLASAAIPNLFPAVWVDGHAYWDGIFSANPPVAGFLQKATAGEGRLPDEIWVIQVNRTKHMYVPETPSDVFDRRNQLAGNLSLRHELEKIEVVNYLIRSQALTESFRVAYGIEVAKEITVRFIRMSEPLAQSLDYPSKLSRQPAFIAQLVADGETQANAFLADLPDDLGKPSDAVERTPIELH